MRRLLCALTLLLIPAAMSTAHAAHQPAAKKLFPVTITDDRGNRVHLAHQPKRIITLFADYTEILFALGLENRIVADASKYAEGATGITGADGKPRDFRYPAEWPTKFGRDYPVRAPQLPHVEGGFGGTPFNLETMESLHPDLVFAPYYPSEDATYQKMQELGMKVVFLVPATTAGIFHGIQLVGRTTGELTRAAALVNTLQTQLKTLKAKLAHVRTHPRVFYEIDATDPNAIYTAGPGTVVDQAIGIAGGINVAHTIKSCSGTNCYPQLDQEALVQDNPQVIILADAAYGTSADSVRQRQGWGTIAAVQQNKIYPMNPDLLSKFGPRVVIGVRTLAKILHPRAFTSPGRP
jgi:iron complex transport system substrate-binding protein